MTTAAITKKCEAETAKLTAKFEAARKIIGEQYDEDDIETEIWEMVTE